MNAVRHAGVVEAVIRCTVEPDVVTIAVEDEGRGFDPAPAMAGQGFGLLSVQERMQSLGGALVLLTADAEGCVALLRLPLTDSRGSGEAK